MYIEGLQSSTVKIEVDERVVLLKMYDDWANGLMKSYRYFYDYRLDSGWWTGFTETSEHRQLVRQATVDEINIDNAFKTLIEVMS